MYFIYIISELREHICEALITVSGCERGEKCLFGDFSGVAAAAAASVEMTTCMLTGVKRCRQAVHSSESTKNTLDQQFLL